MKTLQILPAWGFHRAKYFPLPGVAEPEPYALTILAWELLIGEGEYTITGLVSQGKEIVRATEIEGFSGYVNH